MHLIKSVDDRNQEQAQQQQAMQQAALTQQAGEFANSPLIDPSKNPEALETIRTAMEGMQGQQGQAPAPQQLAPV